MATTTNAPTSVSDRDRGPFAAPDTELKALKRAAQALQQTESGTPKLVAANGESVELSPTLLHVLRLSAEILAQDRAVVLDSLGKLISPHEAAELLGFPLHYVLKLVDSGELPSVTDRNIQRLPLADVISFRQEFKQQQRDSLRELARLSQEYGLYDLDFTPTKLKRLAEFDDDTESS